ncbi:MAG: outer membrane protein transport protein, partial [Cocleimonas sp.]|nr:outer membrane protein transport protein [Cocleimonas sp.]
MKERRFKKTGLAISLSMVFVVSTAYATNGLAPTGIGQEHKSMGGAAVANPVNTMSMATNPASASFIEDGWDVELELFKPNRTVIRKDLPGIKGKTYNGDEEPLFFIPGGGYKKQFGNKYAIGLSMYANGGMNTEFKKGPIFISGGDPGFPPRGTAIPFSRSGKTGINLAQLFVSPTLGIRLNEKHSLGVSLNLVYQQFEAKGLGNLAGNSRYPNHFTNKGVDSAQGIGTTLGWMGKLTDKTTLGASYRLETKMSKFKKYKGLFPNQGRMNVPSAMTVGLSHKLTPKTTMALDVQQVYYSTVNA